MEAIHLLMNQPQACRTPRLWLTCVTVMACGLLFCFPMFAAGLFGTQFLRFYEVYRYFRGPRAAHKKRTRDAAARARELASRPRYYEEPDHFFW